MSNIVNTNVGAWTALQNLTASQRSLGTLQSRINSGLSVSSTKDDSAVYNLAQSLRGDVGGLAAVGSSLSTAKSVVDVAVNGAEAISDILNQMKSTAAKADDGTLTDAQRGQYNSDFENLQKQVDTIVKSANFNGINLLKDGGGSVSALKSLYGGSTATTATTGSAIAWTPDTLAVANVAIDNSGSGLSAIKSSVDLKSQANAKSALDKLADDTVTLGNALSKLGSAARTIDAQLTFNSKLTDTLNSGIGNLVDADLAKESANLQALQVKQQLGVQALSIANQAPQTLLSLFRG